MRWAVPRGVSPWWNLGCVGQHSAPFPAVKTTTYLGPSPGEVIIWQSPTHRLYTANSLVRLRTRALRFLSDALTSSSWKQDKILKTKEASEFSNAIPTSLISSLKSWLLLELARWFLVLSFRRSSSRLFIIFFSNRTSLAEAPWCDDSISALYSWNAASTSSFSCNSCSNLPQNKTLNCIICMGFLQ